MIAEQYLDNLDCYVCPDELRKHARRLAMLKVDGEEDTMTKLDLVDYALVKAHAMKARMEGSVLKALRLEQHCELIYRGLPEYARW